MIFNFTGRGFLDLKIVNLGNRSAYNLTFKDYDKDFEDYKDTKLSDIGYIKYGIDILVPSQS